ncbi:MAG: hypothetical protein ABW106_07660 [Steroidobacteraceae bacterium]
MYIFIWLLLALLAGYWARAKQRSFLQYFLLSVLLTPVVAFGILAFVRPDEVKMAADLLASGQMRKCGRCGTLARWDALKCESCGDYLTPMMPP